MYSNIKHSSHEPEVESLMAIIKYYVLYIILVLYLYTISSTGLITSALLQTHE